MAERNVIFYQHRNWVNRNGLPFFIAMKDYAKSFYKSRAWQHCRDAYAKSQAGLCERCLKEGKIVPGEIVHHKVYISPENINNPEITLNWNNLELVCRECHEREHKGLKNRFAVDEFGRVTATV
jgi:5-methylcytosine-specific restriction endonuclease McrA